MQNGYVICTPDFAYVLCLSQDGQGFKMHSVRSASSLNKAMCLHDLTEAKNVLKRIRNSEQFQSIVQNVEIHNVARIYKNFF